MSGTAMATADVREEAMARGAITRRRGTWLVAEHQLLSMKAYGWTLVVGGVGQPLLFLLGIGLGLATFLDTSVADGADGPVGYVQFVGPALLATAAVGVALDEFTYAVMAGFKWRRIYWGINASPVEPHQLAGGVVAATALRMLGTTVAYYLLMLAFGAVVDPVRGALLPLIGLLTGLAFGLPLVAWTATLTDDRGQFAMVQRFVFTPLFLFSGTFYPLATMPTGLQWIGWVSPVWHGSELGRAASYGSPPGAWPVWAHLAVLLAMTVAGAVATRASFTRRMRS